MGRFELFGKGRTGAILRNLTVLGITIFIISVFGEFTVRFLLRDVTTTGDGKSYFSRHWKRDNVNFNSLRFREREFEIEKTNNVYRIAVIGDSFTFGFGIDAKDRFTNLLQKELDKIKNGYEVLNFGKSGTETFEHIPILNDVVLKAKPDFIVLQWYFNDVEVSRKKWASPDLIPNFPNKEGLHNRLYESSSLYFLIYKQSVLLKQKLRPSVGYLDDLILRTKDPESPDSKEYEQTLKRFINICKKNEIPLGIVLFPHSPILGMKYPLAYLHKRVIEICNQEEIPHIDLSDTFTPYAEGKKLWANRFDSHPSSFANSLASERLMEEFGQIWLSSK